MRLSLKDVNTGGLELTIPVAGKNLAFTLGPTRDLAGAAELRGDHFVAQAVRVGAQTVRAGEWELGAFGRLGVTQHVFATGLLANVEVPLGDPLGAYGKVDLDGVLAERLRYAGFGVEAELRLAVSQLELILAPDRCRRLAIDRVEAHELMASAPLGNALIGQATLKGLVVTLDADGLLELTCEELAVDSVEVRSGPYTAQVEGVAISGLHHGAGRTSFAAFSVDRITVEATALPLADLMPAPTVKTKIPRPFVAPKLPDLPFLDHLQGHLNVNAFVDVGIPIIKSRAATHTIRQQFIDGTIDFKMLESGLSGLEDAVLDFEVKPGKLILEKDIPLIPWDNTTLVWWPLDAKEQEVAKLKHRVRLRRLLDYTLTDFVTSKLQPSPAGGAQLVTLRRIELNGLDADVSVGGPSRLELPFGTLRLGTSAAPAVKRARVKGSVKLAPGTATAPTRLVVEVEGVELGLEGLAFLGLSASLERLALEALERLEIDFAGILPTSAQAALNGVKLQGLVLDGLALPALRF